MFFRLHTAIVAALLAGGAAAAQSLLAVLQPLSATAPTTTYGVARFANSDAGVAVSVNFTGLAAQTDYSFYIAENLISLVPADFGVLKSFVLGVNDTIDSNACASKNQQRLAARTDDTGKISVTETIPWSTFLSEADLAAVTDRSGFFAHIAGRPVVLHLKNATCGTPTYFAAGILGFENGFPFPTTTGASAANLAKFFPPTAVTSTGFGRAYMFPTQVDPCRQEVSGVVSFKAVDATNVDVNLKLRGLVRAQHAIHVHNFGDVSDWNAMRTGVHFNPLNAAHACPADINTQTNVGHVGDMGNFAAVGGNIDTTIRSILMRLDSTSTSNIFGHAVVVHAGVDDCARGADNSYTGNAGTRYSYGVIARVAGEAIPAAAPTLVSPNVAKSNNPAPACRVVLSAVLQGTPQYAGAYGRVEVIGTLAATGNALSLAINGFNLPAGATVATRVLTDANPMTYEVGNEFTFGRETADSACGAMKISTVSQAAAAVPITDNGLLTQTAVVNLTGLYTPSLAANAAGNINVDSILVSLAGRPIVFRSNDCMSMPDGSKKYIIYAIGVLGFSAISGPIPTTPDAANLALPAAPTFAVAVMFPTFTQNSTQKTSGFITFQRTDQGMVVTPYLTGNEGNATQSGIHIHENGDISDTNAMATKVHFNPFGASHACPGAFNANAKIGHVGDLGNFAFANGKINFDAAATTVASATNPLMTFGILDQTNILGRAAVVHATNDKCDQGTGISYTGQAGARYAYGVVGVVSALNANALRSTAIAATNAQGVYLDYLNNARVAVGLAPATVPSPAATPSASGSPAPLIGNPGGKPIGPGSGASTSGGNSVLVMLALVIVPIMM